MKIKYVLGDLFASSENVLIHGCNSKGVMGSGVAKIIRDRFPQAFEAYRDAYEINGFLELGNVIWAETKGKLIGNAITQENFGRDPKVIYCDYDAIREAIKNVNEKVKGLYNTVGMPMIGAGLANGSWDIISKIIEEESTDFIPVVYIVDQKVYNSLT